MNFGQIIVFFHPDYCHCSFGCKGSYKKESAQIRKIVMARKNVTHIVTDIAVAVITMLAWISGFVVMKIVYDSIAAAIIFGIVVATIIFCESRFSYITLKSDGKITISKEEVKSNLWQIVAATLVGWVVSIPLVLKLFEQTITLQASGAAHDLGMQLKTLVQLLPTLWFPIILICLVVIIIFNIPTLLKMVSED